MEVRWENLGNGCGVWTEKACRFTTDTLLLAWFSQPKPGEACADLGTGCGVIPALWKSRGRPGRILALEIRAEAASLAGRSMEKNGFSESVRVIPGDVREHRKLLPHQGLDLVACNPPYYPLGSGALAGRERETARHETSMTLEDAAAAARWSLRDGGRFCVCLPAERLTEAMVRFRQNRLEPKRFRLVQSGPKKPPYLFLLECRKGGKPGIFVEPTLLLAEEDGTYTSELFKIYGDYWNGDAE